MFEYLSEFCFFFENSKELYGYFNLSILIFIRYTYCTLSKFFPEVVRVRYFNILFKVYPRVLNVCMHTLVRTHSRIRKCIQISPSEVCIMVKYYITCVIIP